MRISPLFQLRNQPTEGIIDLLTSTTLGTNGARYKHLDTPTRIFEADNPLFLSMERNEQVLGNVTFCRRDGHWYIRYFAFRNFVQGGDQKKKTDRSNSLLKRELRAFFDQVFAGEGLEQPVRSMYAYIDPANDRSKWMSENFGFQPVARLATQSFSRVYPKVSERHAIIEDWEVLKDKAEEVFGTMNFYTTAHCSKPPFHAIKDSNGDLLAFARFTEVHWEIVRLPGRFGKTLTKIIPFIPVLRKLIRPKHHHFLVPEMVWCKEQNPALLDELFSSALSSMNLNLVLWWVDEKDALYQRVKDKLSWGPLHKLIGVNPVDVVERTAPGYQTDWSRQVFVTAFDMV